MQLSPPLLISCNLFPDPFHLRPQKGGLQLFHLIAHGEEFLNEVEGGTQVVAEDGAMFGAQQLFLQELPAPGRVTGADCAVVTLFVLHFLCN